MGLMGSIPGLERFPEGESVNAIQYCCLENPMDRGAWQGIVPRVSQSFTESDMTEVP